MTNALPPIVSGSSDVTAQVIPLPNRQKDARLRGFSMFVDHLQSMLDAVKDGRHVDDCDKVIRGPLAEQVLSMTVTAKTLEGAEQEGFLMAWNWWTAVVVEGDVMSPAGLAAEASLEVAGGAA